MSSNYLMSVDVGTQSAKVIIFDYDGNILCQGSEPLQKIQVPAPLLAIHPDDDLWDALCLAFEHVMDNYYALGHQPEQIQAMGLCVIRCCRTVVKENGELAYPVIGWMDKRLNTPYQYQPEFKGTRYVSTSSGYITHRLTGQFTDTCANYIGWWPMDDQTLDWSIDPQKWKDCNLTRDMVMDVVKPGEVLGTLRPELAERFRLPAQLPVVATAHDKAVEALGAGSLNDGTVLISLGTYIAALTQGKEYIKDSQDFWPFQASIPHRYIYECWGVRLGMWTVSWFRDQFGAAALAEAEEKNIQIEELLAREASHVAPGSEGLMTLHDWAAPPHAEFRKGAMIGFDSRHTRAHMYRSLLEGIAFTLKNHVDRMNVELGIPTQDLVVSGGGANSDLFMQILADVFGVPARRNQMRGSAAVGCAINAGMAVGAFDNYEDAIEKMVNVDQIFAPNLEHHEFYNALNGGVYQHIQQHLDPLLQKLSPLVD
ncbi:FGGY-family carbohydrate kinase [Photobacterium aphoticum]|uniref:Sugar kinase n=3 Tax=Photobacterium aphoticum TaxID=754436 RepID=A0A0J1GQQ3_9GAMM|nr:FGGY-family carbohydrate kinase [Photobacterium aphoticum]KLV01744.1 sugar kinase [Photobacterium aphoticum]GHA32035.1 kinase [Photobacterium aphoticum]